MKYPIPIIAILFAVFSTASFAQVDYANDIQPIFNANCTSCHNNNNQQSGVSLSNYEAVMGSVGSQYGSNIVVAGEPDSSPLVDKIEADPQFGSQMPQGGTPLSETEINLIRSWISEGANEMATSSELSPELPAGFTLRENYPNPFNPVTNISFEVPEAVTYQINVYNPLGALVEQVSGNAAVGPVSVRVDMQEQPSGVYLYKVIALTGNERYLLGTRKMTLVK